MRLAKLIGMRERWIGRLGVDDIERARELFMVMAGVFETQARPLSDGYLMGLLKRGDFWVFAVVVDGRAVGGLTAFALPLTRVEQWEVFLYDIAVAPQYQRQGFGRELVAALREAASAAGIGVVWVPADRHEEFAQRVAKVARTGRIGDGKVFAVPTAWPHVIEF